jgi:hypothetical protein
MTRGLASVVLGVDMTRGLASVVLGVDMTRGLASVVLGVDMTRGLASVVLWGPELGLSGLVVSSTPGFLKFTV